MFGHGAVLELQQDCLNGDVAVSSILRKAKAMAVKLGLSDLKEWIDQELNGYICKVSDLPFHRKGRGAPKFWNPYHGYCPIMIRDDTFGDIVTTVLLTQGVNELESLSRSKNGTLIYSYPPFVQEALQSQMTVPMECSIHFSTSQVKAALDYVRNKVLDWTLELESKGVTGTGFTFNQEERKQAMAVTNHIYGGNIGVLGSVSGDAKNSHFFSSDGMPNNIELGILINQIREASAGLPKPISIALSGPVDELEASSHKQDASGVSKSLHAIRTVLEGAGGNLVAGAILAAVGAS